MKNKTKFNRIISLALALLLFVVMLIPVFMVYPCAVDDISTEGTEKEDDVF